MHFEVLTYEVMYFSLYMKILFLFTLVSVVIAAEYSKNKDVFELTSHNFDKVVHSLNYTTIVKFYAPWCGYCKQLAPSYHKLGKATKDLAVNVAAINCDTYKELCAQYKIQGFPTIMVFRPSKFSGVPNSPNHASEVYNGERTVKKIVDFATTRLKNYVHKFKSLDSPLLTSWLEEEPRVLLLTKSSIPSPLLKSLAIDFLSSLSFGMIPVKVPTTFKDVKIENLPTLIYYNKGDITAYSGPLSRTEIEQWLIDTTGIIPNEGPLSVSEKRLSKYRRGKKLKRSKDEL